MAKTRNLMTYNAKVGMRKPPQRGIPVNLSKGEYVVNAAATASYRPWLHVLNWGNAT